MRKLTTQWIILTLSTMLLAGCGHRFSLRHTDVDQADQTLRSAMDAQPEARAGLMLQAADEFLQAKRYPMASKLLKRLASAPLNPTQKQTWSLLNAQSTFGQGQITRSANWLAAVKLDNLADNAHWKVYQLNAQINAKRKHLGRAIDNYLMAIDATQDTSAAQKRCSQMLWSLLLEQPKSRLEQAKKSSKHSKALSWINLALINAHHHIQPEILHAELEAWQAQHPNHLATGLVTQTAQFNNIRKITLFLPLTGTLSPAGHATLAGFQAAYEAIHVSNKPLVTIRDSADIAHLKSQIDAAAKDGTDLMIGPLNKAALSARIDAGHLDIASLGLNKVTSCERTDQLFQFDLTAAREANQAANAAFAQGRRRAIILYVDDPWGKNVAQAFVQRWEALGGAISDQTPIKTEGDPNIAVQAALKVDRSHARSAKLKQRLKQSISTQVRRRQDFDVLFLAMPRTLAIRVKPLLNFYFIGNIPVYATAAAITDYAQSGYHPDLEGIIFPDLSWDTAASQTDGALLGQLHQSLASAYPKNFNHALRFYALGADAAQLTWQLSRLKTLKSSHILGASGRLTLDGNCIIARPNWAVYQQEKLIHLKQTP